MAKAAALIDRKERWHESNIKITHSPDWQKLSASPSIFTFTKVVKANIEFEGKPFEVLCRLNEHPAKITIEGDKTAWPSSEEEAGQFAEVILNVLADDAAQKGFKLKTSPEFEPGIWFERSSIVDSGTTDKKMTLEGMSLVVERESGRAASTLLKGTEAIVEGTRKGIESVIDATDVFSEKILQNTGALEAAKDMYGNGELVPAMRMRLRAELLAKGVEPESKRKSLIERAIHLAQEQISIEVRAESLIQKFDIEARLAGQKDEKVIRHIVKAMNRSKAKGGLEAELKTQEIDTLVEELTARANGTVLLKHEATGDTFRDAPSVSAIRKWMLPLSVTAVVGAGVGGYSLYRGIKGTLNFAKEEVKTIVPKTLDLAKTLAIDTPVGLVKESAKAIIKPVTTAWNFAQRGANYFNEPKLANKGFSRIFNGPKRLFAATRNLAMGIGGFAAGAIAGAGIGIVNFGTEGVLGIDSPLKEYPAPFKKDNKPTTVNHHTSDQAKDSHSAHGHEGHHVPDTHAHEGNSTHDHAEEHDHGHEPSDQVQKMAQPKGGVWNITKSIFGLGKGVVYDAPSRWWNPNKSDEGHDIHGDHATDHGDHAETAGHGSGHDAHTADSHHDAENRLKTPFWKQILNDNSNTPDIVMAAVTGLGVLEAWRKGKMTREGLQDFIGEVGGALNSTALRYASYPLVKMLEKVTDLPYEADVNQALELEAKLEHLDDAVKALKKGKSGKYLGVEEVCGQFTGLEIWKSFSLLFSKKAFETAVKNPKDHEKLRKQMSQLLGDISSADSDEIKATAKLLLQHLNIELTNDIPPKMIRKKIDDPELNDVYEKIAMALYNMSNWATEPVLKRIKEVKAEKMPTDFNAIGRQIEGLKNDKDRALFFESFNQEEFIRKMHHLSDRQSIADAIADKEDREEIKAQIYNVFGFEKGRITRPQLTAQKNFLLQKLKSTTPHSKYSVLESRLNQITQDLVDTSGGDAPLDKLFRAPKTPAVMTIDYSKFGDEMAKVSTESEVLAFLRGLSARRLRGQYAALFSISRLMAMAENKTSRLEAAKAIHAMTGLAGQLTAEDIQNWANRELDALFQEGGAALQIGGALNGKFTQLRDALNDLVNSLNREVMFRGVPVQIVTLITAK